LFSNKIEIVLDISFWSNTHCITCCSSTSSSSCSDAISSFEPSWNQWTTCCILLGSSQLLLFSFSFSINQ